MENKTEIIAAVKEQKQLAAIQDSTQITPSAMLQLAQMPNANIENLGKLMEFQIQWEANEARKAFNKALGAFKAESLTVTKNNAVAFNSTAYKHATLDNVCNTIVPALSRHGLSHRWDTNQDGKKITVTCILSHELGHSEKVALSSEADGSGNKNGIQAIGSTVSYLQRYTLLAATGTATTNQDDDGDASGEPKEPKETKPAKTLPDCTAEKFESMCVDEVNMETGEIKKMGWKSLVESGSKTAEYLIAQLSTKYVFSDEQIKTINSWSKKQCKTQS